jgi:nucleotide-binding universal stress UspA family protein
VNIRKIIVGVDASVPSRAAIRFAADEAAATGAELVLAHAVARTAELLIIGDSRRPGTQPGTLGSVAYDVLLNLTSPTMVIHTGTD